MQINIPFPREFSANTYQELKSVLKQFELVVHHAQKAVDNAEKDGIEISEDSFICFKHPLLDKQEDNLWEELQNIELEINLV